MKHYKAGFLFVFVLLFSAAQAQQGETKLDIRYNVALPMGDFKNYVSSTSFRGFNASVLHGVSDKVSVGLEAGFQDYYQKYPRQMYHFSDGSDVSAVVSYTIQTIPVLAKLKYNFNTESQIQPYAALGVGGNLIAYNQLYGQFGEQQTKFGFAAKPEAGLFIPFRNKVSGFGIGASYNIMPFKEGDFKNLNNVSIHAGFSIPLRK